MLGTAERSLAGRAGARRAAGGHAGGRRPGDGRRVGRPAARRRRPAGAGRARSCRARACSRRTCPRRACSPASRARAGVERADAKVEAAGARAARARPARGRAHRRPSRSARPTCSSTAARRRGRCRSRASATPTARRTAPAARTPRCSPPSWRSGRTPLQAARAARALAGEAVGDGLRDIGAGAGPVDVLGLARCAAPPTDGGASTPGGVAERAVCHNRLTMKLLRMKPGHGEIVLAEGDVEVPEQERELIEAFRRELDAGMWAAVPLRVQRRAPPGGAGQELCRGAARRRARDLLPARRRRRPAAARLSAWRSRSAPRRSCSWCCCGSSRGRARSAR